MLVFVYGTLLKGESNHSVLDKDPLHQDKTLPEATLLNLGHFPAVVFGGTTEIVGEVYEVDGGELARLDRLEGYPTFYGREEKLLASGATAWVYYLEQQDTSNLSTIDSGSWRRHLAERVEGTLWLKKNI